MTTSNTILGQAALLEVLKAVGEPTRLRLLRLLAHEELSVMELVHILHQSQPRISRHLKLMSEAGVIDRFPDGAWVFYRLSENAALTPLVDAVLAALGDEDGGDLRALEEVRGQRLEAAQGYFENIAPVWDQIRSHYVDDGEVEAALVRIVGDAPVETVIDLGTGSGRMLSLLASKAKNAIGLDLSQQMLNIARARTKESGLSGIEFRHGDITSTRLNGQSADLVIIHQVLHFLSDPGQALKEAARLLRPGGRLLIVDFAPHRLEVMRDEYQHRRLGIGDDDMDHWHKTAGLRLTQSLSLPPHAEPGLTVRIWLMHKDN
ncbi:metalloregulator ArsR/SmtB family transcription factor [Asticcacaulis sp. BYS171W]|uniref:Metalloregulator ArsR/SmtB family transcription factor n=1 Tax=Asticcacaulis aquaticus TaxID=2984212 RepID=A0ABT5HR59_9CAUL|nr:metalloregulator ArsR/SmtB family transcription factor [Asticcacaulis aquaticus]MDC7682557.1 metalloregulator ArsR/SmtB family transcription factor [Asticcacaulis aquaticus]